MINNKDNFFEFRPKYQENIKIFFVTIDVQKGSLFGYICYSLRFVACFLYLSYITYYGHYISFAFTKTNLCVIQPISPSREEGREFTVNNKKIKISDI